MTRVMTSHQTQKPYQNIPHTYQLALTHVGKNKKWAMF
jgi:hypothetical protein